MANFTVSENWVALSSLTTIDADKEYLIQVQEPGGQGCELWTYAGGSAPTKTTKPDTKVPYLLQGHYKKGSNDLYVRAAFGKVGFSIVAAE